MAKSNQFLRSCGITRLLGWFAQARLDCYFNNSPCVLYRDRGRNRILHRQRRRRHGHDPTYEEHQPQDFSGWLEVPGNGRVFHRLRQRRVSGRSWRNGQVGWLDMCYWKLIRAVLCYENRIVWDRTKIGSRKTWWSNIFKSVTYFVLIKFIRVWVRVIPN